MKAVLAAVAFFTLTSASITPCIASGGAACCKVCSKGKACGDSCIARHLTCHKGKGCACDG